MSLTIVLGPMYAGKTSNLIGNFRAYQQAGRRVLAVNYAEDTRYSMHMLSSHDQDMIVCTHALALYELSPDVLKDIDIIMVNEAQFFPDVVAWTRCMVDEQHKQVELYGLDGDFLRQPFESNWLALIPFADEVVKIKARCATCGQDALFSHRLSMERAQKVIGSSNYVPLCRKCYLSRE